MARFKRLAAKYLLPSLAFAAATATQAADPGLTDTTVRIGQFGALTGPGYFTGKLVIDGADIVYKEVNKAGGINGRKIETVREDDRCDPATAIGAAKKLIFDHKVFVIHGGGCSNASIGAYPEIKDSKAPWVIFASVADSLTLPTVPTIYTTALTAAIESASQVAFAAEKGAKRIAVISTRDAWGRGRYDAVMAELKRKGIKPVADEEIIAEANDATPQALRLQQANADAVIMLVFPKAAAAFLRDADKIGFAPLAIGQTALGDLPVLAKQVGSAAALQKMFAISHVRHMPDDKEMADWRKLFETYYPGETMSIYHLLGIGSAQVVVEALKRAGRDLTRDRFVQEMDKLTDFDTPVYPGPITCTAADHQCHKHAAWVQLVNGRVATVATTTLSK
ncbi:ABC transporter substrate-binding protein [Enterovirga sp. CN4-39]|uniref:ABC transporter substrate-binding protein n=1 Tax=Enterovirga sp. CN4-39 TaxID=3400910 RepID=UPI003C083764